MNQGVEMLLARMESHPEEFDYFTDRKKIVMSRWDWVVQSVCRRVAHKHKASEQGPLDLPFLPNDEVDALYNKFMSVQGHAFTKKVMHELLVADQVQDPDDPFATQRFTTSARFGR